MKRILTLVVAVLCSAVIFAQADLTQNLIKKDFTKETPKTKIEKPSKTRDGDLIFSCTFEESTPRYTVGQNIEGPGNWEIATISEYSGESWCWTLNSTDPEHPYGVVSDSPEHWMKLNGGGIYDGYDIDSYILFSGIDFSESMYPQVSFYEYRRLLNIPTTTKATVVETSVNGGASWTEHLVGCEESGTSLFALRRVPIFEVAGFEDVMIRFRARRSESIISSYYTGAPGYEDGAFILLWEVDDVVIEEAAPFDFVITDVRMNKGECDIYSNPDYASELGADQLYYYQYSPMFGQVPVSEWTSPSMYASFNVAVENRGSEPVVPMVNITITNPNGEEIWTVDFEGEEVDAYGRDTIDVIEWVSDTELDKIFYFTEEQMQNIVTGRYLVTYTVSTDAGEDPTPANNTTSHPFYITEEAYSPATPNITRTCGPNSWASFQDGHEILADFEYTVLPEGEIPVYVYISESTTPDLTSIAVNIYEKNPDDNNNFEMTTTSGTYTIQESDLGKWIEIPFEAPLTLTEFDSNGRKEIQVGVAFYQNGEDNDLYLGASNDMSNKGWICLYNTGSGAKYTNVLAESVAPAICLGNPNPEVNYTITVNSADEEMGTANGGGEFANGTQIQISATPNDGYRFTEWNDGSTANPRNITVRGNATYTAYFEELPVEYTITVVSDDDEMGSAFGGGTYYAGDRVSIYAVANDGYVFLNWDDGNEANPRTITVTGDATYTAEFGPATAVEENVISAIAIYPNPTSGIVNFANVEDATIEIYNMMGQVVASMNNASSKTTIDLSGVANGNYVVRIVKNGEVVNSQINIVK
ncbi:MAG: T9SS type A sorting domain-containing protein [Bacteroidales bacterium]|nr:T9SS type A sorting domain-containing protein [Bacteroidales bacterium]